MLINPLARGRQLEGVPVLVEVLYYMPDACSLLQSFVHQFDDRLPDFPRIHRFLRFWAREIDAAVHSVTVSSDGLLRPTQVSFRESELVIH